MSAKVQKLARLAAEEAAVFLKKRRLVLKFISTKVQILTHKAAVFLKKLSIGTHFTHFTSTKVQILMHKARRC